MKIVKILEDKLALQKRKLKARERNNEKQLEIYFNARYITKSSSDQIKLDDAYDNIKYYEDVYIDYAEKYTKKLELAIKETKEDIEAIKNA